MPSGAIQADVQQADSNGQVGDTVQADPVAPVEATATVVAAGTTNGATAPLAITDVSFAYDGHPVLDRVSLCVQSGEVVALLGESGCGKTTLLRAVAGLVTPARGVIELAGHDVTRDGASLVPPERRHVGFVFQDYALFPSLSVRRNIAFGLRARHSARRVTKAEARERVDGLIRDLGLEALAHRKPATLSGGQQQRVALARALAPRPSVVLLDEPFASIDARSRGRLARELVEAIRRQNATALIVTHDRREALALSARVAVMTVGAGGAHIAQCDAPAEVYQRPVNARVATLIGIARIVPGHARGSVADTPLGTVALIEPRDGDVEVVLRPESLTFDVQADGNARVSRVRYTGRGYIARAVFDEGEADVEIRTAQRPAVGQRGHLGVAGPVWALPPEAE